MKKKGDGILIVRSLTTPLLVKFDTRENHFSYYTHTTNQVMNAVKLSTMENLIFGYLNGSCVYIFLIYNVLMIILDKCQNLVDFHSKTRHLVTYFVRNLCKKSPML
jgi:hypothetical protein